LYHPTSEANTHDYHRARKSVARRVPGAVVANA